ncbi:glycosyltransferase family 4 protein, partial [Candidatus Micrarchaeota archaeon]|nr:glycosyltransferase family 4 protein [Candidatus Micrarchaeota archaeon]
FNTIIANGVIATLAGIAAKFFKRLSGERVKVIARPAGIAWVQPQYNFLVKAFLLFLETTANKLADAVVLLSPQEREQFEKKMGFLPKRIALIPTGVDAARFERANGEAVRKQLGLRGKTIVFIGRLIQVKGLEYLIQAMQRVRDAQLVILGDGPLRARLEEQARELGVEKKIVFVKRGNAAEFLKAGDVFVLPSVSEGLPIALLEAMAAKRACVVTDIGLPVRDGIDGLVVPAKSPNALANALNKVLADAALRKRLGENANERVKKEFTWKNAVGAYLKLARGLLRT